MANDSRQAAGRVILIRHGRTAGNKQRYVGWEDLPLDDVGVAQAQQLAHQLADQRVDGIYASPLSRALATARPLAEARGLAVQVRDELKEIDYGKFQGLLKSERKLRLRQDYLFEALPGGESLLDVYRRAERLLAELRPILAAGSHLILVGHFWSLRMLVGLLQAIPFGEDIARSSYEPANGSAFELCCENKAGEIRATSARWLSQSSSGGVPD